MAGLSSLSKNINIKGQPHSLAYINKAEAALLKARGGSGKPTKETNGIPSYEESEGDDIGGWDDIGNDADDPDAQGFGNDLPGMDPTDDPSPPGRNPTEAEFDALGLFAPPGYTDPARGVGRTLDFNKVRTRAVGPQFYEFKQGMYPHSWQNTTVDTLEMGVPQQSAMLDDLKTKAGWDREEPDSAVNQLNKFGPPPPNVVTNRHGQPIAFEFGWLTQEEEEEEEFAPLGKLRKKRILPKIPYERQRKIDALDFRLQMQSPAERTSELMRDPSLMWSSTDYGLRTQYQDAIRNAAKSMTENEVLGVMGPDGNRVGGFINTLEDGGFFDTHGLGIRGPDEITSPEGMNEEQHNRYKNLFMADDGTEGNALRMALDAAKGLTTVGDVFGDLGVDAKDYGLNAMMGAERVSDYLDMTAFEGIIKGFPTFLSVATGGYGPLQLASTLGGGKIFKELIDTISKQIPEALRPAKEAVEEVVKEVGDVIPDEEDITRNLGTLFGVKTPEYFAKEGFYNKVEPTIDSLLPDDVRAADAVERGPVVSDRADTSEKDSVARAVERRELASLRPGQPETYIAAANERNVGRIDEDLVGDQPPFRPARPGEVQPETIASMRSDMYDNLPLPAGPAVPVTPVERQALSPGSVMSAYEASLEPSAVPEDVRRDVVTRQLSPDQTLTDEQTAEIMAMIDNPSIASPDTLTAADKEIEQPVLEDISQLPPDVTSSEDKTFLENYVKNNVKKGFMTLEEGNAILEADTSKKLKKAIAKFIARSKKEMASQARQTNRRSEEQNNRLSKQAQKEKAKRAGVN